MDKTAIYNVAIDAAIEAGAKIMEIYESSSFGIESKKDDSPLTLADIASNEVIAKKLQSTDIPVISEENKEVLFSERKDWDSCWIVDPLDGTKEFIKRNGEFTVNIALCNLRSPVFGIIYVPVSRELFVGDVENGKSFRIVVPEDHSEHYYPFLEKNQIFPNEYDGGTYKVVGSRSHMNAETEEFVEHLKTKYGSVEVVSKGSSLKFCLVAQGKADIYPRNAPTMEWDTAAGHAICNAVGLKVTSSKTGQELRYNKENLLNDFFTVGL